MCNSSEAILFFLSASMALLFSSLALFSSSFLICLPTSLSWASTDPSLPSRSPSALSSDDADGDAIVLGAADDGREDTG